MGEPFGGELYGHSSSRFQRVDLSTPVTRSTGLYIIKTRKHDPVTLQMLIIKPFKLEVWLYLLLAICLASATFYAIEFAATALSSKYFLPFSRVGAKPFWVVIRAVLRESEDLPLHCQDAASFKVLITMWTIAFLIIHSSYSGFLITHLSQNTPPVPFKTTQEVADAVLSGKFRLVTYYSERSTWTKIVQNSDSQAMATMRRAIAANPPKRVKNMHRVLEELVADPTLIGIGGSYGSAYQLKNYCDLTLIEDTASDPRWMSFIFPHNPGGQQLRELFDRTIPALWPLYEHLKTRKYLKNEQPCGLWFHSMNSHSLGWLELKDSFWVWMIGLGLSFFIFIFELLKYYKVLILCQP